MSQPPDPHAKRRRLDYAASALSRPFKSPLPKSAQRKEPANPDTPNAAVTWSPTTTEQQSLTHPHKPASVSTSPRSPSLNIKSSGPETDPEIISLRKERLTLQSQLTSLRTELDTAQQALRIESSSRDDELRALKLKWRGISQRAAEELFETAKDKIERMGGVGAWKESERQRVKRMQMWEDEEFYAGAGADGEEGGEGRGRGNEVDDYEEGGSEQKEDVEEETFTLDMMLKSLNIEPAIIGFDMTEKRWKSD